MSIKPIGEQPVVPDNTESDDLTAIKGIGQTRQQWLQEKFNIRTFSDLAALPPDEIMAQMKTEGQIISRSRIEAWIKQAQMLASDSGDRPSPTPQEAEWKPFAAFVVEFQELKTDTGMLEWRTHVHHMEADLTQMWPNIEQHELCRWIAQQLGDKALTPATQAALELAQSGTVKPASLDSSVALVPVTIQPGFSQNLQQILAKAARVSSKTTVPVPPSMLTMTGTQPTSATQPIVKAAGETNKPQHVYSERMEEILAKVQRLSSKKQ